MNGVYKTAFDGKDFDSGDGAPANRIGMVLYGLASYTPMPPAIRALSLAETAVALKSRRKLFDGMQDKAVALEDAEWAVTLYCVATMYPVALHAHWEGPQVVSILTEAPSEPPEGDAAQSVADVADVADVTGVTANPTPEAPQANGH